MNQVCCIIIYNCEEIFIVLANLYLNIVFFENLLFYLQKLTFSNLFENIFFNIIFFILRRKISLFVAKNKELIRKFSKIMNSLNLVYNFKIFNFPLLPKKISVLLFRTNLKIHESLYKFYEAFSLIIYVILQILQNCSWTLQWKIYDTRAKLQKFNVHN